MRVEEEYGEEEFWDDENAEDIRHPYDSDDWLEEQREWDSEFVDEDDWEDEEEGGW
jgi:hypothetical protein